MCCVQVCAGKVLQCLTDNKDAIKADSCKKEVRGAGLGQGRLGREGEWREGV